MIEQLTLVPTQWTEFPDVDDVQPISDQDQAVLLEVREVLQKHGALKRFGVTLIHRHFELNDGEVLFESTNCEERRQVIEVKPAAEVFSRGRVLETQWVFDDATQNLYCVGYCDYNQGHKHGHNQK
jgi:hypothetical protein